MGRGGVARLEFRAVRGAKKPDSLGRIGLFGPRWFRNLWSKRSPRTGVFFVMANHVEKGVVLRCALGLDCAAVASDQVGDEEERRQGVEVEGAVLAEVQRNDGGAVEGLEGFESVVDHSVKVWGGRVGDEGEMCDRKDANLGRYRRLGT